MTRITVQGIAKSFGAKRALRDVSFEVGSGEAMAVIGPSGCGKTTLLRSILGELEPDDGCILFDDEDVVGLSMEHRRVGVVYQGYALFPHMTVGDNVGYGLRVRNVPRDQRRARVQEVLDLVCLEDKAPLMPHELSGGERQRVALARALAVQPRILLLDEAFAALDATTRAQLLHEVREIVRRLRLTTLLVTHDQEDAFTFGDRVLVMQEGRSVACGTPSALMISRSQFLHEFVHVAMYEQARVQRDEFGMYADLREAGRINLELTTLQPGDAIEVVVKRRSCERAEAVARPIPRSPAEILAQRESLPREARAPDAGEERLARKEA